MIILTYLFMYACVFIRTYCNQILRNFCHVIEKLRIYGWFLVNFNPSWYRIFNTLLSTFVFYIE